MQLTSLSVIKSLLKKHDVKPSKYLGQNFLISQKVLEEIIEAAEISKEDIVLEIGPGIGVLTLELAKRVKKVVAIEKDQEMVRIIRDVIDVLDVKNIEIVQGDILENQKSKIKNQNYISKLKNYKIVANIPYYITSPIIRMFLETKNKPELIILMVQKEVAQRICAKPPKMSLLSVSVQFYAEPKIITYVSKNSFWPRPKVDSAILKILPFDFAQGRRIDTNGSTLLTTDLAQINTNLFFKIVKAGFSSKRKFLANNLSRVLKKNKKEIEKVFIQIRINPKSRAENLSIDDWVRIYEEITKL